MFAVKQIQLMIVDIEMYWSHPLLLNKSTPYEHFNCAPCALHKFLSDQAATSAQRFGERPDGSCWGRRRVELAR